MMSPPLMKRIFPYLINSALCICCLMFPTGNSNRVDRQAATLLKRVEGRPRMQGGSKTQSGSYNYNYNINIRILRISREVNSQVRLENRPATSPLGA